ncbi:MAG: P-loop NTPase [Desulfohalobiaceae bacterium]|nr:P-loop NTPase [Desulfohalobiaceae bacterium]
MTDTTCGSCSTQGTCQDKNNQDAGLQKSLSRIKNKLVVLSGKGGVGKSSTAANIAVGLSLAGKKVGLMDVDVHGPTIPRLLNLTGAKPKAQAQRLEPVPWSENLLVISLGFLIPNREDSVIWRGPIKMSLIRQFIEDVNWGDLDYLVVDCPPGTGDEPISVMQLLGKEAKAVIVTTPQDVAVDDVRRSVNFCRHTGNPVLGIVENMSGFICPHCHERIEIFNAGGGEKLAREAGIPLLGKIPLDPEIVKAGDLGEALLQTHRDSPAIQEIKRIIERLQELTTQATATEEEKKASSLSGKNGRLKIAVPTEKGKLCAHFGHCEQFTLITVDRDKQTIQDIELLSPPPHEPGVLPQWLAQQQADMVIAGGLGAKAQELLQQMDIQVITGAAADAPEELVNSYLRGDLATGANVCDH